MRNKIFKTTVIGMGIILAISGIAAAPAPQKSSQQSTIETRQKSRARALQRAIKTPSPTMDEWTKLFKEGKTEEIVDARLFEKLSKESEIYIRDVLNVMKAYQKEGYAVTAYYYGHDATPTETGRRLETHFGNIIGKQSWLYLVIKKDGEPTQYFGSKDKPVLVLGN